MDYRQTLDFLYNSLPEFQRVGASAYKPGLDNTIAFNAYLEHPDRSFRAIHVAGTNGKGSVSHIIASVLQKAGYRTGLYTSPHLADFRERIRVDGAMMSEDEVVDFVAQHHGEMTRLGLSFFEMTVGMAFDHFRRRGVDIAVVETGLGGRLDSTNIITPLLSVITNIGFDHTGMLGDTIAKIAYEKAGIIKPSVPVVVGESSPESDRVFEVRARESGSPVIHADREWRALSAVQGDRTQMLELERTGDGFAGSSGPDENSGMLKVELDLMGDYQRKNIITCMAAFDALADLDITREAIREGCAVAARSTGLTGRWQRLGEEPLIVCDTGHNEHGIRAVVAQIARQKYDRLYMVVGFVADKELSKILPLLPRDAYYFFTQPSNQRALPAREFAEAARKAGLEGEVVDSVSEALAAARKVAAPRDMIFVGGSTFVVADLL